MPFDGVFWNGMITIMDNPKVFIGTTVFGKGLFADEVLEKDECIAEFDGEFYSAQKVSDLPPDVRDHAIQCGKHQWRDSNGIARYINHSCEPNVGWQGLFTLVAMRRITKGEELLLDYDMSENSDWHMNCLCGTNSCRRVIGAFRNLPHVTVERYNGYISEWLKRKDER